MTRTVTTSLLSKCDVQAAPIVRVAIEPLQPADMPRLMEGLRLLNRADPLAEVTVQETGEHVLGAAGVSTDQTARCMTSGCYLVAR